MRNRHYRIQSGYSGKVYRPGQTRPRPHLDDQHYKISRADQAWSPYENKYTAVEREGFWETVSCERAQCRAYQDGFVVKLDLSPMQTPEHVRWQQWRAHYIRYESDRSFMESWEGATVIFKFSAEQRCFKRHRMPVHRDPVFIFKPNPRAGWQELEYPQFFDGFNETSYQLQRRTQDG